MINSRKLKGRMVELGFNQSDIARELGIATSTVSQKINNIRPMDINEAEKICTMLLIPAVQFGDYFFSDVVA